MKLSEIDTRETGPLVGDALRASNPALAPPPPASAAASGVLSEDLDARNLVKRFAGPERASRMALLGILLAELQEVPFEDVAELLDVKVHRLEQIMHGEVEVPPHREKRWKGLAEALHYLHRVLEPAATARWLRTEIPDLGGRTPLEALKRGQVDEVVALTKSYVDPSFG